MRRLTSYIGVTLLALALSGGGNALAAALCPHAGVNLAATEDRSNYSASVEKTERPHAAMQHQAAHCMKTRAESVPVQPDETAAVSQPTATCEHCVGRADSPATASASALSLKKLGAGADLEQPARLLASVIPVFTTQFVPTQHAPPGQSNRKHLLLSVFLI